MRQAGVLASSAVRRRSSSKYEEAEGKKKPREKPGVILICLGSYDYGFICLGSYDYGFRLTLCTPARGAIQSRISTTKARWHEAKGLLRAFVVEIPVPRTFIMRDPDGNLVAFCDPGDQPGVALCKRLSRPRQALA